MPTSVVAAAIFGGIASAVAGSILAPKPQSAPAPVALPPPEITKPTPMVTDQNNSAKKLEQAQSLALMGQQNPMTTMLSDGKKSKLGG